jgi:malonyl-CoA/methylmalonyl-CoA synthetase
MSDLVARFLSRENDLRPGAIVDARGEHTYADLIRGARAVAASLLAGRTSLEGARVAVLIEPGGRFVSALFGVLLAGGCGLVLSPLHPLPETTYFCEDAGVVALIVSKEHAKTGDALRGKGLDVRDVDDVLAGPPARELPAIDSAADALQLYTSGTTGKPKGAVLMHENLSVQQRLVGEAWAFSERDVLLHSLPLHHMHGLAIALLTALGAGASVRMTTFDARAIWEDMAKATVFMGVPAMYHRLFVAFDAADEEMRARWTKNAAALRLATSGSAALPVTLAEKWRALGGSIPLERFGMTEIGVGITNLLDGPRHAGCVGLPLPTVETRIVGDDGRDVKDGESGELLIRGPSVFARYHARPKETAAAFVDEWFRTGDTVVRDPSLPGAPFRILGRTSVDILKSGGYKLSALEIEEVLRAHPDVSEVAVVGIPDEAWGDRVVAAVVARPQRACDEGTLRAFAKERLAAYKVPKQFVFMDELPKNALGKVVKPQLARMITGGQRDA